jgi:hypothetical protein
MPEWQVTLLNQGFRLLIALFVLFKVVPWIWRRAVLPGVRQLGQAWRNE